MIAYIRFDGWIYPEAKESDDVEIDLTKVPLSALVDYFTSGACWHLAVALNAHTGMQLWNVGHRHVVVSPNGKDFLDITGWHDEDELRAMWNSNNAYTRFTIKPMEVYETKDWNHAYDDELLTDQMMTIIIERLLDAYPLRIAA